MYFVFRKLRKRYLKIVERHETQRECAFIWYAFICLYLKMSTHNLFKKTFYLKPVKGLTSIGKTSIQVLRQRRGGMGAKSPSFSEITFYQERFWGKFAFVSLSKASVIQHFWPRQSQNFVGGLYVVWKNSYNLASSG